MEATNLSEHGSKGNSKLFFGCEKRRLVIEKSHAEKK